MYINRNYLPKITEEIKQSWEYIRQDFSAGGIAYRSISSQASGQNGIRVALIATRGRRRWQLPKGTCEQGETSLETAMREVWEEVGLTTAYESKLKRVEYWYWDTHRRQVAELVHKQVDFYLLRAIGGSLTDDCIEIDCAGWFTPQRALHFMTFDNERELLQMALAKLKDDKMTR